LFNNILNFNSNVREDNVSANSEKYLPFNKIIQYYRAFLWYSFEGISILANHAQRKRLDRRRPFFVQKNAKMPVFIIPSSSLAMYFTVERSPTHFYHGRPVHAPRRVSCLLHGNVNYDILGALSLVVQRRRRNKILENNSRSLSHLFIARNASVVKCHEISFCFYLLHSLCLIGILIFLLLINFVALTQTDIKRQYFVDVTRVE